MFAKQNICLFRYWENTQLRDFVPAYEVFLLLKARMLTTSTPETSLNFEIYAESSAAGGFYVLTLTEGWRAEMKSLAKVQDSECCISYSSGDAAGVGLT